MRKEKPATASEASRLMRVFILAGHRKFAPVQSPRKARSFAHRRATAPRDDPSATRRKCRHHETCNLIVISRENCRDVWFLKRTANHSRTAAPRPRLRDQ